MTDDGSVKERLLKMPDRISGLAEIVYNLWWSWHPGARMLFKMLNRIVWKESGHNPVQMLRDFPPDILKNKDFGYISEKCSEALAIVKKIRNQ